MKLFDPPDDANCPKCGSKQVFTADFRLPLSRFLSWATRRLLRLRMRCLSCGGRFSHLHALPRTVIGYHGCSLPFARELLAGRVTVEQWKASENNYDWLGTGVYFWEHAPGRAWQWAKQRHGDSPAVVATEIRLGTCLDLGDTVHTDLLQKAYHDTVALYRSRALPMPRNEGKEQKLRKLDRLIIDQLADAAKTRGLDLQTVRCPFEEGEAAYHGGMIREQSHIQIAVRDKDCISSLVFLADPEEKDRDEARTS